MELDNTGLGLDCNLPTERGVAASDPDPTSVPSGQSYYGTACAISTVAERACHSTTGHGSDGIQCPQSERETQLVQHFTKMAHKAIKKRGEFSENLITTTILPRNRGKITASEAKIVIDALSVDFTRDPSRKIYMAQQTPEITQAAPKHNAGALATPKLPAGPPPSFDRKARAVAFFEADARRLIDQWGSYPEAQVLSPSKDSGWADINKKEKKLVIKHLSSVFSRVEANRKAYYVLTPIPAPLPRISTNYTGDGEVPLSSTRPEQSFASVTAGLGTRRTASAAATEDPTQASALERYFNTPGHYSVSSVAGERAVLTDYEGAQQLQEHGFLGMMPCGGDELRQVHLNTHQPFTFVTVGVQGAGKSHSLSCVLEACMVPCPAVGRLQSPMSALVLHYDESDTSICEAVGLITTDAETARLCKEEQAAVECVGGSSPPPPSPFATCLPKDKLVVLVSPAYLPQRRKFYGSYCDVKPLLLRWETLTADHIKRIMGVKQSDNQLYMGVLFNILRQYQKQGTVPPFEEFRREIKAQCERSSSQSGPLDQRLSLLASMVAESDENAGEAEGSADLYSSCAAGVLVVVDLTDPLLSHSAVNGIFQVLVQQYRAMSIKADAHARDDPGCTSTSTSESSSASAGKLLVLDEAHKYMNGDSQDGLSEAIVTLARVMRHDGVRLVVGTQSPKVLAPELLELVSVALIHKFHSRDWFRHLAAKLSIDDAHQETIADLQPGHALAFAHAHSIRAGGGGGAGGLQRMADKVFKLHVRPRLTADWGATRGNG